MKSCPFCMESDLHDDATKCPHCGEWLKPRLFPPVRLFAEAIGWMFLAVFIVGLAGCGFMALSG
jgi:hypothetical protein